jgi:hypothetical protein
MAINYDVFISYASADRAWADRLQTSLAQRGLAVFQDTRALRIGEGWEDQLDEALLASKHLICLWSQVAKGSGWVTREVADFRAEQRRLKDEAGLLLVVQLDATPNPYASLQQAGGAAIQQAYHDGVAAAAADWDELVERLDQRLKIDKNALVVPMVPLTLTAQQLAAIPPQRLADLAGKLGIDAASIPQRYGASRLDWQPFGDGRPLRKLLSVVKGELDQQLAPRVAQWLLPDEAFWSDQDDSPALAYINAMRQQRLGAIVIDPIALLDADVMTQLGRFHSCLNEEGIAVIVPPPLGADPRAVNFRAFVRMRCAAMLQEYFDPPTSEATALRMRVGVGVDDKDEILRLVRQGLGLRASRRTGAARPAAGPIDNTL